MRAARRKTQLKQLRGKQDSLLHTIKNRHGRQLATRNIAVDAIRPTSGAITITRYLVRGTHDPAARVGTLSHGLLPTKLFLTISIWFQSMFYTYLKRAALR